VNLFLGQFQCVLGGRRGLFKEGSVVSKIGLIADDQIQADDCSSVNLDLPHRFARIQSIPVYDRQPCYRPVQPTWSRTLRNSLFYPIISQLRTVDTRSASTVHTYPSLSWSTSAMMARTSVTVLVSPKHTHVNQHPDAAVYPSSFARTQTFQHHRDIVQIQETIVIRIQFLHTSTDYLHDAISRLAIKFRVLCEKKSLVMVRKRPP
jgi:hypothetical protein